MKNKKVILNLFLLGAIFGSCAEAIEKSLTNEKVELAAPVNNLVSADSLQTLYWQRLDGAKQFQLQVVSPKFDSIVKLIADTTITSNFFLLVLDKGVYQWRVRAFNASSTTPFSSPWTLTIQ